MGSPRNFICKTCKKDYYLGYGSSPSWLTERVNTIEAFDNLDSINKNLAKNLNYYNCLLEHQTHDWVIFDDENTDLQNKDETKLIACYTTGLNDYIDTIIESDWNLYEHIDMTKSKE